MQFITLKDKHGKPTKSMLIRDDGIVEEYTKDENGETVVKIIEPTTETVIDEDMALTNGTIITPCADVESVEGWSEIDEPTEETET